MWLHSIRSRAEMAWANLRAASIPSKAVVFESDDWGSIRLRDRIAFESMERQGLNLGASAYNSFDCLERKEDLESLLEVLGKYKDLHGQHPKFTLNTVVCNPDFERIQASNFENYYYESFFDSYARYYGHDLAPVWRHGIDQALIYPQFHAREHLNVPLWMRDLRLGHTQTRLAFAHQFYGLRTKTSSPNQIHYVSAYSPESQGEYDELCQTVADGLAVFKQTFGFRSTSLVACNYVWPQSLEPFLADKGIRHFQTRLKRFSPNPADSGKRSVIRHYTGQINRHLQTFGVRNVLFEPYSNRQRQWVRTALNQIDEAFFFKAPAIICTHRINYCSHIRTDLKGESLRMLSELIKEILKRWPQVQFMTSDQLAELMRNKRDQEI
jgi:hypothetical protein